MKKVLKSLPVIISALGLAVVANQAKADDIQSVSSSNQDVLQSIQRYKKSQNKTININADGNSLSQITSVSQLSDVQPTDWAYEALRGLVERYGCIVGYPDGTFKGNKALSRWEFAAGLNACMNSLERIVQEGYATKADVETLKKLAAQFQVELAALGARVNNLDNRVSFLENHQFSTTTKLAGEVVIAIAEPFGGKRLDPGQAGYNGRPVQTYPNQRAPYPTGVAFGGAEMDTRVRLNFNTSFTGKDQLKVRLQADSSSNGQLSTVTGVNAARLGFDDGNTAAYAFGIDDLWYKFPVGNLTVMIGAAQMNLDDVMDTYTPFQGSSGTGSVSRAERYNSLVYRDGSDGAGLALNYKFSKEISLDGFYLVKSGFANNPGSLSNSSAANPEPGNGLFNGGFVAGTQFNFNPNKDFKAAFTYVHTYDTNQDGSPNTFTVASPIGNNPFNCAGFTIANETANNGAGNLDTCGVSANRFGLQATWNINKHINFTPWIGYASMSGAGVINNSQKANINNATAETWTWNVGFNFPDLGKEGAVLYVGGGLLPSTFSVTGINGNSTASGNYNTSANNALFGSGAQDRNASYIAQVQYAYPFTKNIQITPAFYVIFNPNNMPTAPLWVGVLRGTFSF